MEKKCARCNSIFDCRADNIALCSCAAIKLSDDCKSFLEKTFYSCLCVSCLQHINQLSEQANVESLPINPTEWVLNKHYYSENGQWVFTELFHYLKGACCGNNCRHCVYGKAKDKT